MPSIIYVTEKESIDEHKLNFHKLNKKELKVYPEGNEDKWGKDLLSKIIKTSCLTKNITVLLKNTDQLWKLNIYDKLLKTLEENETITFISMVKNIAAVPKTIRSRSIVIIDKAEKHTENDSIIDKIDQKDLQSYSFKELRIITKIIEKYDINMRYNLPLSDNINIPLEIINE